MKKRMLALLVVAPLAALLAALSIPRLRADQNEDEAQIRAVQARLGDAWNHHDMKAWANEFTEDADFVNVVGWWWRGRAEIETKHAASHAYMFRDSVLAIGEVQVRFLAPQVAVVHMLWSLKGQRNADGTPGQPRKGIFMEVLVKQGDRWLVSAAQNTDQIPEMPFPVEPPKK